MQPAEKRTSVSETILAAMQRTNELFDAEVIRKQNFDALNRIYTAQARVLPPGAPMVQGREQIKEFWKQAIAAMGVTGVKLTILDAEPAGFGVTEIGRADLTIGDGHIVTVKYVVCWKQEDGAWKWNVDIWNKNE
jgi:ketosteroid isomerase-like protein